MSMHKLSSKDRKQIIVQLLQGDTIKSIVVSYEKRGETVSRQTIWRWLKHYRTHDGSTSPLPRGGRPTKLTPEVLQLIDSAMQGDDETTAQELVVKLHDLGFLMSKRTVLAGHKRLGWTPRGSAYCQLIRDVNKQKTSAVGTCM